MSEEKKLKVVIVGGGAGGASTAARLRRQNEYAEIILIEKEAYISSASCGLPYYIGGVIKERDYLFIQTPESFNKRFLVDVRTKSEVIEINRKAKSLMVKNHLTGDFYTETYDKLVLATGTKHILAPAEEKEGNRIFSLKNITDSDSIKSFIDATRPKHAIVIGGGFIGLEIVENLHRQGMNVSLIEKTNQVLHPFDFSMAAIVHQHLQARGISLYLNRTITSIEQNQNGVAVSLSSDENIEADMLVSNIGIRPNIELGEKAGLKIGEKGGLWVDSYLQTSDKDIYAIGDAIEVKDKVLDIPILASLAGPANKQGRIVANNIANGNTSHFQGCVKTVIAKIFDLTVAKTGTSARELQEHNIAYLSSFTHTLSHAGYYPGASFLTIKIMFDPKDGRLFGAQVIGMEGVDKRIDLFSQVVNQKGTIYDLCEIEQAYAPPYSSPKDPVNMAGYVAENILNGQIKTIHWREIDCLNPNQTIFLDVRTKTEYEEGHLPHSINIPIDELRNNLDKLQKDKKIVLCCAIGLRGYIAGRILLQHGFLDTFNLSGGFRTYAIAKNKV